MIYLYYFFALIQTLFAYQSLRGGIDYRHYFQQEINKSKSKYRPFASIIIPCRGLDTDLYENLVALIELDYPDYELLFVVDDKKDLAVPIIEEVVQNSQRDTKLIVAGKAKTSGQKVHNLRQAVLEVSDKSEVFVFVDSDARPKKNWLQNLIAPLEDEKNGCATGYRWFIQKKNGFATHLRAVWNASIASALGENTDGNFCWGGSTAIRRTTFEKLDVRKKWEGTLSDDFALTNALREANLPIHFVPQCLTATVEDTTLRELIEFSTRQMKITRVYSPLHFG
jgi:cellulose synthase/poly-beta-1,6-N-acetylglucosamine synthase-like glycosyltransferase